MSYATGDRHHSCAKGARVICDETYHQQSVKCSYRTYATVTLEHAANIIDIVIRIRRDVNDCGRSNPCAKSKWGRAHSGDIAFEVSPVRPDQPTVAANAPGVVQQTLIESLAARDPAEHEAFYRQEPR
jgi:hypothetical protein